mmetsp:Transcript_18116/g.33099  ORF Transcript_18116/g.33099 Transcript_18116/m.33099 type:complete len:307 (-) Transcript_18116:410-1330(-)|eukprot:CAMPEP_0175042734 /NCGR_PEP_ID=MMETSP0052_2-20121109/2749_1 /TAXON_ID=51329 ORGANISM="Polytomella parva, Strain SAG 63-3" /NCGR_SAMPLE_ID=MMETSP0052_2 /ASSEMBLY_ACC=CAM_ASM_000194 /LENGTH=306 /DNA_ID=CAMNT_0016305621 /DNA_START=61 /DNA_END=981 /DNA_ORIENTATION=-
MAMAAAATSAPPMKPWEKAGATAAMANSTGVPKPWEQPPNEAANAANAAVAEAAVISRPPGSRPWETPQDNIAGASALTNNSYSTLNNGGMYGSSYGGYNSGGMYGNSYSGGMYGSSGLYGNSSYGSGGYSSGMYGSGMYGSSMYGGGMYNSYRPGMYGGGMYGNNYGMGMPGQMGMDPNAPPMRPAGTWQTFLNVFNNFMNYCGRLSFLINENTQAFHFLISALLQFLDRAGSLYAEIARFVLRLLLNRFSRKSNSSALTGHPQNQMIPAPPQASLMSPGPTMNNGPMAPDMLFEFDEYNKHYPK